MSLMPNRQNRVLLQRERGFTLMEILIALFIFTLISMIMVTSLHSVISAQSGTEATAERVRKLQTALLIMSRDIEQTINRPIMNTVGKEEAAFVGTARDMFFTHAGLANPSSALMQSSLQRTHYTWHDDALWRGAWRALDQAPQSQEHARQLLDHVTEARFQYLDHAGHFHEAWPVEDKKAEKLPLAVRVEFTISQWGKISQLYVIAAEPSKTAQQSGGGQQTPSPSESTPKP